MQLRPRHVLALVSVLVMAACGGAGTAANSASPAPTIKFTMTAQNGSGVSGTGVIVKGAGSFTVTVKLTAMAPGSRHVSHLHDGRCSKPGGIAFALQPVVADSSGAATITSTVPAAYQVPTFGWYVNVHNGPDFTEPEYAPSLSCGDLNAA